MNSQKDDKPELTNEEIKELRNLIKKGKNNFSKETLESAVYLHPANLHPSPDTNIIHSASADYLFRCEICTKIDFNYQWYKIILDEIGGSPILNQRSNILDFEKGFDGKNIAKLIEEDKTEYFNSSLNIVKDREGYICDHCRISCYDDEGNPLD